MMRDLFESVDLAEMEDVRPLAERQRPRRLDDLVGQDAVTREGGFLAEAISKDRVPSLILWATGMREDLGNGYFPPNPGPF